MSFVSLSTAARAINELDDAIQALPLQSGVRLSVFLPDASQILQDSTDALENEIVQLEQYSEEFGRMQIAVVRAVVKCGVAALLVEKHALEVTIERLSRLLSIGGDDHCEPSVVHSALTAAQKRFEQGSSNDQMVRVAIVHEKLAARIHDRICIGRQRLSEIKSRIYELGANTMVEIPDR